MGGSSLGPPTPELSHPQAKPAHLPQDVSLHHGTHPAVPFGGLYQSCSRSGPKTGCSYHQATHLQEGPGALKTWMAGMNFKARERPQVYNPV